MGLLLAPLAAGLLVGLASFLAARTRSAWAGFAAATPITPSLAVLSTQALSPVDLLHGLPIVAAATACMAAALLFQRKVWMPSPAVALLVGIPYVFLGARLLPSIWIVGLVAAGCLALDAFLPTPERQLRARRLPWFISAGLGAVLFAATLLAIQRFPAAAALLAVYPVLLVISLLVTRATGGAQASRALCRSTLGANVAVAAFVVTPTLLLPWMRSTTAGLTAAWVVYLLVALGWPALVRLVRPRTTWSDSPVPCVNEAQPGTSISMRTNSRL